MKTNYTTQAPMWRQAELIKAFRDHPSDHTFANVVYSGISGDADSQVTFGELLQEGISKGEVLDIFKAMLSRRIHATMDSTFSPLNAIRVLEAIKPDFKPVASTMPYVLALGGAGSDDLQGIDIQVKDLTYHAAAILNHRFQHSGIRIGDILLTAAHVFLDKSESPVNDATRHIFNQFFQDMENPIYTEGIPAEVLSTNESMSELAKNVAYDASIASVLLHDASTFSDSPLKLRFFSPEYLFTGGFLTQESVNMMVRAASIGLIPKNLTMRILREIVANKNVLKASPDY